MVSSGGGTGFDATDLDAPSSQLIAFVNLDSHSQSSDDHPLTFQRSYPFPFVVLPVFLGSHCLTARNCMLCHMPSLSRAACLGESGRSDRRLQFYALRLLAPQR